MRASISSEPSTSPSTPGSPSPPSPPTASRSLSSPTISRRKSSPYTPTIKSTYTTTLQTRLPAPASGVSFATPQSIDAHASLSHLRAKKAQMKRIQAERSKSWAPTISSTGSMGDLSRSVSLTCSHIASAGSTSFTTQSSRNGALGN